MVATQKVALGVGAGGALVDVSSYITGPEGVSYSWGRQSEFRDPAPGQVSFVLDNYDGRFTPGNAASPLATPITEGTAVCWQLGTRLVGAVVSAIGFASSETEWGRVTITCGDMAYIANRTQLTNGLANAIAAAQAYQFWPFTDVVGSGQALEAFGGPALFADPYFPPSPWVFGASATGPAGDQQMSMTGSNGKIGTSNELGAAVGSVTFAANTYPAGSNGAWGLWVTTSTTTDAFELDVLIGSGELSLAVTGGTSPTIVLKRINMGGAFTLTIAAALTPGVAHYLAFASTYSGTTYTTTVYLDGAAIGSQTYTASSPDSAVPSGVLLNINSGTVSFSHLSHSPWLLREDLVAPTTVANRLTVLAQAVPQITLGTLDSNIAAVTADVMTSGSTVWSAFCDLLRTEQGHLYMSTSGTLLSPTTVMNVRARTRPTTVTLTLDMAADLNGVPPFDRDITNLFGIVTATGPSRSATVTDAAAVARVGSAYVSETVVLQNPVDLVGYAQDRMLRGENVALKVSKVDVDTLTSSVTVAQLLALLPGDRIRITGLPGGPLGFTTWDGWFLGAAETHNYQSDAFTLYLAPVLPRTGIFDTDLFQAGGSLSLGAALAAAATTMTVASADGTALETVQVPYALQIDSEQVNVTACTALSGGTQTATISRAVNGTTAAAHASGALVDVATPALFAF